jgi:hypothetical protein
MSELPARPDPDQLRRQARELLRAATEGQLAARDRLRAVSDRVTLSAAQLALAREYGFSSWPALRAEAERRRSAELRPQERRSFGGAEAIDTAAGRLAPGLLIIGPDNAALAASLTPASPRASPHPRGLASSSARTRARAVLAEAGRAWLRQLNFDDVVVRDDQGRNYGLRVENSEGHVQQSGQTREPISLTLKLDPIPARGCRWFELRNQQGTAARLLPSARPAVRISQAPAAGSQAEQALAEEALWLISLRLDQTSQDADQQRFLQGRCARALGRAEELRRSGELDPASGLPGQLAGLCASLAGQPSPADGGLPVGWTGMLGAAERTDGTHCHLDIAASLPPVDDVAVQVDSLISESRSWRIQLCAHPSWWIYSKDGKHKRTVMSVRAEDNLGGMYVSTFGGSTGRDGYEDLVLMFRPRLDPAADSVELIFASAGAELAVRVALAPVTKPELRP